VVEAVLAVVGDVEVFPSVVVIVADADALAPAGRGQTRLGGDVGEGAVVIVVIQAVGRALPGGKSFELRAIHQKDVRPAVVVIVENCDAGSGGFDDVFFAVDAAESVLRGEAGFLGQVDEGRNRGGRRRGWLRLLPAQVCSEKQQGSRGQGSANGIDRKKGKNSHGPNRC
jgi:hypothetical protein